MATSISSIQLEKELRLLLPTCDMTVETSKSIRKGLEDKLGLDLKPQKKEITDKIKEILTEMQNAAAEEEEEAGEDDEEGEGQEEEEEGEESDEMDEDEEAAVPKRRAKPKNRSKKTGTAPVSRTETALSEQLMAFLGTNDPTLTRQEVMKRMSAYIKEKELPKSTVDKRKYVCDDALQELLGVKSVNIIAMNKYLTKHIKKYTITMAPTPDEDEDEDEEDEVVDTPYRGSSAGKKRKAPAAKGGGAKAGAKKAKKSSTKKADGDKKDRKPGGFAKVKYYLSPQMAAIVGEPAMARPQVVKQLWVYIKANNLQNPDCKSQIFCDDKLKTIFKGESMVTMFSMNKYLSDHIKGKVEE